MPCATKKSIGTNVSVLYPFAPKRHYGSQPAEISPGCNLVQILADDGPTVASTLLEHLEVRSQLLKKLPPEVSLEKGQVHFCQGYLFLLDCVVCVVDKPQKLLLVYLHNSILFNLETQLVEQEAEIDLAPCDVCAMNLP